MRRAASVTAADAPDVHLLAARDVEDSIRNSGASRSRRFGAGLVEGLVRFRGHLTVFSMYSHRLQLDAKSPACFFSKMHRSMDCRSKRFPPVRGDRSTRARLQHCGASRQMICSGCGSGMRRYSRRSNCRCEQPDVAQTTADLMIAAVVLHLFLQVVADRATMGSCLLIDRFVCSWPMRSVQSTVIMAAVR